MSIPEHKSDAATSSTSGNDEWWEKILGPSLIQHSKTAGISNNGGEPAPPKYTMLKTGDALKDKELVLFYFGMNLCRKCQDFSLILKSFYKLLNDKIEIIYISSDEAEMDFTKKKGEIIYRNGDRSISQFDESFGTMPWLALPVAGTDAIKTALSKAVQLYDIPTLVVMTREGGLFVTNKALKQVTICVTTSDSNASMAQDNAEELVRQWREDVQAVPLSVPKLESGGGFQGIMKRLMDFPLNHAMFFVNSATICAFGFGATKNPADFAALCSDFVKMTNVYFVSHIFVSYVIVAIGPWREGIRGLLRDFFMKYLAGISVFSLSFYHALVFFILVYWAMRKHPTLTQEEHKSLVFSIAIYYALVFFILVYRYRYRAMRKRLRIIYCRSDGCHCQRVPSDGCHCQRVPVVDLVVEVLTQASRSEHPTLTQQEGEEEVITPDFHLKNLEDITVVSLTFFYPLLFFWVSLDAARRGGRGHHAATPLNVEEDGAKGRHF